MSTTQIISEIEELAKEFSFVSYGFAPLTRPLTMDFYLEWLDKDHFGSMQYLKTHADFKENPQKFWPLAKSSFVFAKNYHPHPKSEKFPLQESRVALYAQGEDYHQWFKAELVVVAQRLKKLFPEEEFLALTDSSPVLERDLAYQAGLGWFGKNTCLIHPKKGSLFFLGEIYTSLTLVGSTKPLPDFCGHCNRCIEICPTQALEAPRILNANKCISYLTIESKTTPPLELREKIGDWLFGCDLCQTVCPWNQKNFKEELTFLLKKTLTPSAKIQLISELQFLMTASGKALQKEFLGTALQRAGPFGLRRNAVVVAANQNLKELIPEITALKKHQRLKELAEWALEKLSSVKAPANC